jgi:hypothetical protein
MPCIPLYATAVDFELLREWLNGDDEIAYIVAAGSRHWIAVPTVEQLPGRRVCLWHTPSGPLPLLDNSRKETWPTVPNPWSGWEEVRTGADPSVPYFGAGHVGIIWLNMRPSGRDTPESIGQSSFEWIGNWYGIIGHPAAASTKLWWEKLRRRVKKAAAIVPRGGPQSSRKPEIFALPDGYSRLSSGAKADINPTV